MILMMKNVSTEIRLHPSSEGIVHETGKKLLIDHFNFQNLRTDYSYYKLSIKKGTSSQRCFFQ